MAGVKTLVACDLVHLKVVGSRTAQLFVASHITSHASLRCRFEFPDELDLDRDDRKYHSETSDPAVRNLYKLHSVLVHSGGVHGGHYYAFIRPDGKQWYKYDDERVTIEDDRKAMDEQFGEWGSAMAARPVSNDERPGVAVAPFATF